MNIKCLEKEAACLQTTTVECVLGTDMLESGRTSSVEKPGRGSELEHRTVSLLCVGLKRRPHF